MYGFPKDFNGSGQTIAIIELGGGFRTADLDTYFSGLGLATPSVQAVSVDGATNSPTGDPNGDDGEVMLDIEVAGAIAPAAAILVYFAPLTDQGFIDAVSTAALAAKQPCVISISWGGPESGHDAQAIASMNGSNQVAGGTSAVAPLWAGLIARMSQYLPLPGAGTRALVGAGNLCHQAIFMNHAPGVTGASTSGARCRDAIAR